MSDEEPKDTRTWMQESQAAQFLKEHGLEANEEFAHALTLHMAMWQDYAERIERESIAEYLKLKAKSLRKASPEIARELVACAKEIESNDYRFGIVVR